MDPGLFFISDENGAWLQILVEAFFNFTIRTCLKASFKSVKLRIPDAIHNW